MTKNDKILNLGCGNSRLGEDLSEEGYEDITNIDFSAKVISIMEEKCKAKFPKMSFKVMDALNMKEFQTGSFNTIIDKGTLDSILCADNSVPNAQKMLAEVFRVLAPGGHYICITYGDPEHRKKFPLYLYYDKAEIKMKISDYFEKYSLIIQYSLKIKFLNFIFN